MKGLARIWKIALFSEFLCALQTQWLNWRKTKYTWNWDQVLPLWHFRQFSVSFVGESLRFIENNCTNLDILIFSLLCRTAKISVGGRWMFKENEIVATRKCHSRHEWKQQLIRACLRSVVLYINAVMIVIINSLTNKAALRRTTN